MKAGVIGYKLGVGNGKGKGCYGCDDRGGIREYRVCAGRHGGNVDQENAER